MERPVAVQAVSALVMQLVQVAAELPPVDADVAAVNGAFNPAMQWADKFWQAVFARWVWGGGVWAEGEGFEVLQAGVGALCPVGAWAQLPKA